MLPAAGAGGIPLGGRGGGVTAVQHAAAAGVGPARGLELRVQQLPATCGDIGAGAAGAPARYVFDEGAGRFYY
jgi:hypothetical protein